MSSYAEYNIFKKKEDKLNESFIYHALEVNKGGIFPNEELTKFNKK